MNVVLDIVSRNLRLYFRDRLGVFFSLLAALILFLLYTLFLGDVQTQALAAQIPGADEGDVRGFVGAWMFAGIISLTSITTGLGALSVFVEDGSTGRFRDVLVSPIRREQLVLGYVASSTIVSLVMTGIVLAASVVYLALVDGYLVAFPDLVRVIAAVVVSCVAFTTLSAFVVSLVHSIGAFSALSTIVGTTLGFLAGAYLPLGNLPEAMRNVLNVLPFAEAATLVREPLAGAALARMTDGAPQSVADEMRSFFGLTSEVGAATVSAPIVYTVLVAMAVLFSGLAVVSIRRRIR